MQKSHKIAAAIVVVLVGSVLVSRAYHSARAVDPEFISKRKVNECFLVAKQLMKSPSGTTLIKSVDLGSRVSVTVDAPNSFGVKLRSEVVCEMKEQEDPNLKGYFSAQSATVDGKPVDEMTWLVASSNALLEKN